MTTQISREQECAADATSARVAGTAPKDEVVKLKSIGWDDVGPKVYTKLGEGLMTVDSWKAVCESICLNRRDVNVDGLRNDVKLAVERVDGLRQFVERAREDDRKERAADRGLLFALVRDHNRRLRAIERLESRRQRS